MLEKPPDRAAQLLLVLVEIKVHRLFPPKARYRVTSARAAADAPAILPNVTAFASALPLPM